jgi:agmatinase
MSAFLGLPSKTVNQLAVGDIAFIGATEATPYIAGRSSHAAGAPDAVRAASQRYAEWGGHYDFDLGASLEDIVGDRLCDLGNLPSDPTTPSDNREAITQTVKSVLGRRALPLIVGGDDSVPIPVLAAYEHSGPIWILQVDAHIDWRHERYGEPLGWSSTMRRASEMPWVAGIVQVGIRGVGSARVSDVSDARTWGAKIFTARDVHALGVTAALSEIPRGARVFISLDCDGLDPSIMPAVGAPVPGGLLYSQILDLFDGLKDHECVGMALVELVPQIDVNNIGTLTVTRLLVRAAAAFCEKASDA